MMNHLLVLNIKFFSITHVYKIVLFILLFVVLTCFVVCQGCRQHFLLILCASVCENF